MATSQAISGGQAVNSSKVKKVAKEQLLVDCVTTEPECENLHFAWKISKFKLITESWSDFTVKKACVYRDCCNLSFSIGRELAGKKSNEEPDSWIFTIKTIDAVTYPNTQSNDRLCPSCRQKCGCPCGNHVHCNNCGGYRTHLNGQCKSCGKKCGCSGFCISCGKPYNFGLAETVDIDKHLKDKHDAHHTSCSQYLICQDGSKKFLEHGSFISKRKFTFQIRADQLKEDSEIFNGESLEFRADLKIVRLQHFKSLISSPEPAENHATDFGSMLETGDLSDFTIETGGESFKVHKAILAARSPVFKAIISTDMKEKRENSMKLDWISEKTTQTFLRYIYTDILQFDESVSTNDKLEVLQAAHMYQIPRLKILCENELLRNLSHESIVDVLRVADTCGAKNLRDAGLKFVKLHWSCLAGSNDMISLIKTSSSDLGKLVLEILSSLDKN